jgi:phage terminase large subunit-like protein
VLVAVKIIVTGLKLVQRSVGGLWTRRSVEMVGESERAYIDRPQPAVDGELPDRALGVVVVGGDEDVERLPGDLAFHERAAETWC